MNGSDSEPERARASCPAAPIDFSHLARYTLGDKALEQEVLALFAAEAPATLGRLRSARTGSAWREAAHTLKGSARAVGARKVAVLAEEAERLSGEAERQELTRGLQEALEEVVRFIASLGPAKP